MNALKRQFLFLMSAIDSLRQKRSSSGTLYLIPIALILFLNTAISGQSNVMLDKNNSVSIEPVFETDFKNEYLFGISFVYTAKGLIDFELAIGKSFIEDVYKINSAGFGCNYKIVRQEAPGSEPLRYPLPFNMFINLSYLYSNFNWKPSKFQKRLFLPDTSLYTITDVHSSSVVGGVSINRIFNYSGKFNMAPQFNMGIFKAFGREVYKLDPSFSYHNVNANPKITNSFKSKFQTILQLELTFAIKMKSNHNLLLNPAVSLSEGAKYAAFSCGYSFSYP